MIRRFENQAPQIAETAFVDETAVIIGDVSIGDHSSIWPMTVIRADINKVTIGKRCSIQDGTVIHVNHVGPFNPEGDTVLVGDDVTVGHRALLHGCEIGDRCLIGMAAVVMDRVVIESDVFVAGGSLVTPNSVLKSGYLYMGAPARQVRELTEKEREKILYSAEYYAKLGQRHSSVSNFT